MKYNSEYQYILMLLESVKPRVYGWTLLIFPISPSLFTPQAPASRNSGKRSLGTNDFFLSLLLRIHFQP